ncbi:MAG: CDP-alcohol phosphatidyltransferase family protein [bacterium]
MLNRELFYISNLLSISRIIFLIPIYYLLKLQTSMGNYLAVLVMILAATTDIFDGRLARRLNQVTVYGRILDPVVDKICIAVIGMILVATRDLPFWYFILIVVRDIAILLIGLILVFKTKMVVESNIVGKVTVTALAVVVIAFTLELDAVKWFFLWCSVVLIAASSVIYLIKMVTLLREKKERYEKSLI